MWDCQIPSLQIPSDTGRTKVLPMGVRWINFLHATVYMVQIACGTQFGAARLTVFHLVLTQHGTAKN